MTWYVALIGIITIVIVVLLLPNFFRRLKTLEGEPPKAGIVCKKKFEDEP